MPSTLSLIVYLLLVCLIFFCLGLVSGHWVQSYAKPENIPNPLWSGVFTTVLFMPALLAGIFLSIKLFGKN